MKAYTFLAEGFEEIEALAVVDVLRRAHIETVTVSIGQTASVTGSHNITVMADSLFNDTDCTDGDLYFLPGGLKGTENLMNHSELCQLLIKKSGEGRHIAAVCAAPSILGNLGLLQNKRATCYPGFEDKLKGAISLNDLRSVRVVTDGNITTSRGMGTSVELGLELVSVLTDENTALNLARTIQHI